jgi:hypothetical protein
MTPAFTSSKAAFTQTILWRVVLSVFCIVCSVFLLVLALPQLWYPLWFDQGAFAACADVIRRGGVMFRDCWDVRGPAAAFAYVLPMLLSPSPVAIHAFDLAWQALTAVLLGVLARRMFGTRAGILAAVLYWLLYASVNYWATAQAEGFANLFFVLALWLAWSREQRIQNTENRIQNLSGRLSSFVFRHASFLSGVCLGVLFWFKYPFALIAFAPAVLIAVKSRHTPDAPRLTIRPLLWLGAGFAAAIAVGLLYFALGGALAGLQQQIAYDVATFNDVPLAARLVWLRTTFREEIVAFVSFGNTPTAGFKDTVEQLTILGRGYPFVMLLALLGLARSLWNSRTRAAGLYALAYVALTFAICIWQGHFYRYPFVIMLPAVALLASAALPHPSSLGARVSARVVNLVALALAAAAMVGLAATMLPWAQDAYENAVVHGKGADELYLESKLAPYSLVAKALNEQTAPGDTITVFSDVPAVYALAQRRSGTRFPYLRWAEEGQGPIPQYADQFLADLQRNQPVFFVLTQPDFPWPGADFIRLWKSMPAVNAYVEANYHYVGENGPFLLFRRNAP